MANVVTLSLAKLSNPFAPGLFGEARQYDRFSLLEMQYANPIEVTPLVAPAWMGNWSPIPLTHGPTAADSVLDLTLRDLSA